jgi:hypothetical protein
MRFSCLQSDLGVFVQAKLVGAENNGLIIGDAIASVPFIFYPTRSKGADIILGGNTFNRNAELDIIVLLCLP